MTSRMSSADLHSAFERLDECTRAIYGCSFQEFLIRAINEGFKWESEKVELQGVELRRACPKHAKNREGLRISTKA
jgi:hypothetical protein